MNHRLANSLFWTAWSRAVLQGLSLISTLVVARLLSPGDYAVMALATLCVSVLITIVGLGMGSAIIQYRDLDRSQLNSCFWLTIGASIIGYLLLYALAPAIAAWFEQPPLTSVVRVLALLLPLAAARTVPDALLRKDLALDKVSQVEMAAAAFASPLVFFLALAGAGVWALVAGLLGASFIQTLMTMRLARWVAGFRLAPLHPGGVFSFGLASVGTQLCWLVYDQADTIILGKMVGGTALGLYALAKQLATMPTEKISTVATLITSAVMAQLQSDLPALRNHFLRTIRLTGWLTVPLTVGIAAAAQDLVSLALGPKWLPLVPILQAVSPYVAFRSLAVLLPPALLAKRRASLLLRYNLALLAIMPLAFYAGAVLAGAVGVASAWSLVYPFFVLFLAWETTRELVISQLTLAATLWPPLLIGLLIIPCAVVAHLVASGDDTTATASRLVLLCLTATITYGLSLLAFGSHVRADLGALLSSLLRPAQPHPS
jgi:O-antigen/teichoic acid export membrane protein